MEFNYRTLTPDHDGDVLNLIVLLSDEANNEINDYLKSPMSMIDATGKLIYGLSDEITDYQFYATTYHPLA